MNVRCPIAAVLAVVVGLLILLFNPAFGWLNLVSLAFVVGGTVGLINCFTE